MLKKIRLILAIISFLIITFLFIDFAGILPKEFSFFAKIQFVPALLSLNFIVVASILIITFLFGRIYCSIICPMGIIQDLIAWFSKKIWKKRKYKYYKTKHILRFTILGIVVLTWLLGYTFVLGLLDPYSSFGRISTDIFQPIYIIGNNLLESLFKNFNIYVFYKEPLFISSMFSFLTALTTFLIIIILSAFWGRTYCNTICPVGTILGYFSKLSLFKIKINDEKCNKCGLCATKCKSFCINSKEGKIDYSRCVDCFNCINTCKKDALRFTFRAFKKKN